MSTKKMYFPVIICIVIVAALVFGALFGLERAVSRSDAATAKLSEMTTLSNDIMQVNDKLIKLIRVYIINGDETAFNTYNTILDDPASFNDKLDRMIEIGLNNEETASVDKILGYLDILAEIEGKAIDAKDAGNDALASTTLFGNDYISTDSKLSVETENLINLIKTRFSEVNKSSESEVRLFLGITVCLIVSMIAITALIINSSIKKSFWYESLLDSLPLPISVTDMNMNWTFINKPVEQMLNVKRPQVLGKHCSNWGAGICKTDNCGITCLRSGKTVTFFEQLGMDFRVDISYLNNAKGKKIGHIEVVQDISEMMKAHKKQSELVKEVTDVASTFASGSHQIANGSNILAQGSTQQAAAIEELSASITAMSEKTKANAEKATRAATLADSIKQNAENGSRQMNEMMTATKEINEASHDIGKVIKVIDDIAFQTNILALNAAVEAARAGQHGKGFAVVADEVRNLAAKSAEAAKDTGSLIANSMEKAEFGARVAGETAASLAQIVEGINESTLIVTEIAESSSEQSSSIAEITRGIDQVAQVVHQNSATAEESAAASAEISEQAKLLEKLVNNDLK